MISQSLQLTTPLNTDSAMQLGRSLESVEGVQSVAFAPATNRVNIMFDGDKTSVQELTMVLMRAGYAIDANPRRGHEGGCCGGGCS